MRRQRAGDFPPGTKFAYSNAGYTMLSLIAQRVTGQTMDAVARENLRAAGQGEEHAIPGRSSGWCRIKRLAIRARMVFGARRMFCSTAIRN